MVTIRNAREDDVDTLRDIGFRSWEKAMAAVGEMTAIRGNALAAFDNFTRSAWLTIVVAEQAGVVRGWAARERLDELISDFWVDPQFQGQGLGSSLLDAIEGDIVRQGLSQARIETHARNDDAVRFFEKYGYRITWLSASYSAKLDREVQSVGMLKQLVVEEEPLYGPDL